MIVYWRLRVGESEPAYGDRHPLRIEGIGGRDQDYQIESALAQLARFYFCAES